MGIEYRKSSANTTRLDAYLQLEHIAASAQRRSVRVECSMTLAGHQLDSQTRRMKEGSECWWFWYAANFPTWQQLEAAAAAHDGSAAVVVQLTPR